MSNVNIQNLFTLLQIFALCSKTVVSSPKHNVRTGVTESNDSLEPMTTPVNWKSLDNTVKCKFQPFTFKCGHRHPVHSYYYDIKMEDCVRTMYGHCQHALNNFATRDECKESCRDKGPEIVSTNLTKKIVCHFQPDFGNCHQYLQRYYFDINEKNCRGFAYSGCGGNENRFFSSKRCQSICDDLVHLQAAYEEETKLTDNTEEPKE